MGYLTANEILSADDIPTQDVSVPEWGGTVKVRGMNGTERDRFDQIISGTNNGSAENVSCLLISMCVVGENNELLFSKDDVIALGKKNGAALTRIFRVAFKLSGLGKDTAANLAKAPAASTSDSPAT